MGVGVAAMGRKHENTQQTTAKHNRQLLVAVKKDKQLQLSNNYCYNDNGDNVDGDKTEATSNVRELG